MMWRVVRLTDRGYVTASPDIDDFKPCKAELHSLSQESDDYFAIQEMPSGAVVWDEASERMKLIS